MLPCNTDERDRGDPKQYWRFLNCGQVPFTHFLKIQDDAWNERINDLIPDTVIFAEHPPTISLGARPPETQLAFLRVSPKELAKQQIPVLQTVRGGSITLHAPGVLGCYIVVKTPGSIVAPLERLAHAVFAAFGIPTSPTVIPTSTTDTAKYRGAWAHGKKIASIGLNNSRGVTRFGINFNVSADPRLLDILHPCGIRERVLTTMALEGSSVSVSDVRETIERFLPRFL